MRVLFVYPNINGFHYDNYHHGLASIVSVTRQANHDVEVIIITNKEQYSELLEVVRSFKPQIVGFTSVSSQFHFIKEMSSLIKNAFSSTFTVCGGVHPTIFPDALLEAKNIDGFFRGESEQSFIEFLDSLETGRPYKDTDNFVYIQEGKIIQNKLKPLVENLDLIPNPDKEIYPYEKTIKELGYAPFFFARGCPHNCSYCSNHALAKLYNRKRNYPRFRSPEICIQEIEEVICKYGNRIDFVWILDDIFGLDRKWQKEFYEKYQKRVKKKFVVLLRVEMVNEDLLVMLKKAGCFRIFFGVESGNEIIRTKLMNRWMSNQKITLIRHQKK